MDVTSIVESIIRPIRNQYKKFPETSIHKFGGKDYRLLAFTVENPDGCQLSCSFMQAVPEQDADGKNSMTNK